MEKPHALYISLTDLNEDLIQNILSGSPRLETFTLDNCYSFKHLDITSKSVKKLVISGNTHFGYGLAILKAPNILTLNIQGSLMLREIVLLDLSSLVEAHLDYTDDDYGFENKEYEEDRLNACIYRRRHVKELTLGVMCSEVLSRLEAEGFIAPSNIKRVVDDGPEEIPTNHYHPKILHDQYSIATD
ncbi:F-box protein-like protein [Tanacetum coccineum]